MATLAERYWRGAALGAGAAGGLVALLGLLGGLDRGVEDVGDGLALDGVLHRLEHVEAFALVFHQRVALADGAQADALLEVVHLVEVLAPVAGPPPEGDPPFQR